MTRTTYDVGGGGEGRTKEEFGERWRVVKKRQF